MALDDPKLRYRIELRTDRQLRWFAQIESYFGDNPCPETCWTASADTWDEALELARARIAETRRRQ